MSDLEKGVGGDQNMLWGRTNSQRTFTRVILNLMATDARLRKGVVILDRFRLILRCAVFTPEERAIGTRRRPSVAIR